MLRSGETGKQIAVGFVAIGEGVGAVADGCEAAGGVVGKKLLYAFPLKNGITGIHAIGWRVGYYWLARGLLFLQPQLFPFFNHFIINFLHFLKFYYKLIF